MKPNKIWPVKCTRDSFARAWVDLLSPYHKLTSREKDVAARIINQHLKLKESISDPEVLRDVLWSRSSRKDMMQSLGMSQAHFQMVLARLREAEFLIDGDINKKYLPGITEDTTYTIQVVFYWSDPKKEKRVDAKQA
ncbi:MAG: hypothetical protein II661_10655 [Bacteroidales bacterium]|nr:hypothetical protein [Bacteroidales bacterium]